MKQLVESPFFYFGFLVLAGMAYYLFLSSEGTLTVSHRDNYVLFMQNTSGQEPDLFAAGPLTFYFYKLLSYIFQSQETAFNAGSAFLGGTLAWVLLKFSSKLKLHLYTLIFIGTWSIISPSIRYTLSHYPHLILGMIFFLLLFLSLMRKNHFLVVVFLVHLFLTHGILAMLSVILVSGMLINRKNATYLVPLSISALFGLILWPGILSADNLSRIFSMAWHFPPITLAWKLNPGDIPFFWILETILITGLLAGLITYGIVNISRKRINRNEMVYSFIILLLCLPVYNFIPFPAGIQIFLAFPILILPGVSLLGGILVRSKPSESIKN